MLSAIDTWRVFPDGRMETTFRLRANLTWHDGEPLSGADFVFAWRVYTNPDLGTARNDAERSIMANGFRQVGFEVDEAAYTPVQARDNQAN
jgi:ABC-type transport system substrate-binding protein